MRLVHLADLHLGFRAYSRTTSVGINRREADVSQAFQKALQATIELAPDLLLIAGDVFHVPRPGNLAVIEAQKQLAKFCYASATEVVIIAGNHESVRTSDSRCILELLALIPQVRVVANKPEAIEITGRDGDRAKVFCLPHNSLEQAQDLIIKPDPEFKYNLVMLHGTVDNNRINDYGGYDVPAKLLNLQWDYVACGHYHSYTNLGNNAFYAGAIERTSNDIWKEAGEDKGLIEFDLATHKHKFHALKGLRETIDLPTIDAKGLEANEINQKIAAQAAQAEIKNKIVRQRVDNLPRSVQRQLDYRQIRTFQAEAVHYLFAPRSPESSVNQADGDYADQNEPRSNQVSLAEEATNFLQKRDLPADVDRDQFVARGVAYLKTESP
ncbi:metallophosphoesterase [Thalassoporum mexicanum PCC 7367]|uniref:metallophosphoesterase family protein n=1 Tax=Thalassoporum mexicanum TaxID=3457544 RepID=UPI00029FCCCA|nr:metallophosphoesterase [Pseudanabaena sp. PCC 7367]AFY69954.1 metallophosphoesterase [Pseudanabaena sp. PCC 7367]